MTIHTPNGYRLTIPEPLPGIDRRIYHLGAMAAIEAMCNSERANLNRRREDEAMAATGLCRRCEAEYLIKAMDEDEDNRQIEPSPEPDSGEASE